MQIMSKIVCIGAHPDDVELSMGGSVLRLLDAGHEVTILDIFDGSKIISSCSGSDR